MKIPVVCLVHLWAFFAITSFYTQAQDLKFRHLTVDDGLSHNTVTCFLQDSQGYMWIGTQDGLNRYDAYNFETYKREIKNPYSLSSNYISALIEDKNKTIWIATVGGGLHRYDAKYNRFVKNKDIGQVTVRFFLKDVGNLLWVGAGNILYYLDEQTGKFQQHPVFTQWELTTILEYAPNELLVGTNGGGIFHLNLKNKDVQQYSHKKNDANSLCYNNITSLYSDVKNNIWVATERGLDRFLPQNGTFEHFPIVGDKTKCLQVESIKFISGKDNEVWFATENGGLSILNIETMRFVHHLPNLDNPESINDLSIWAIYLDKQNRFWVGTYSGGVNILDGYWKKFSKPNVKLKNQTVNALLKDSKNRLWVGTEGGLAVREGEQTTYYTYDAKQPYSLANNPVLSIYEDNKNRIWVGTWAGGLSCFDEAKKQFKNFRANLQDTTQLSDPNIFSVTQSKQTGQILAGSFGGFNILLSEENQTFANFNQSKQKALSSDLVRVIFEDSKNDIWIGTIDGLNKFDIKTKKFTQYLHNNQDTNSISNNYINCFLEDSKKQFWIGTSDGLNLMLDDKKFVNYTISDGLPSNAINGILEDNKGNLWISTNKGISYFNTQTRQFKNYDESEGLQSNQFKPGAAFKGKDGELFFGGTNGFNAFFPEDIRDNPHIPNVIITGLKLFNKTIHVGAADSILKEDIRQTQEITLTHRQSVFTLDFVALNFTLSEKNQYAYKLEPFESEWNYVGSRKEASYTNLDAGTYVFRVKGSNNDKLWNEEGASLKIVVLPPWWETWWFRTFMISMLLGSAYTFYRIRINSIRRQNQILEQKVIQRTEEIEKKTKELQFAYQEIQVINEELHQTQDTIVAQRDLVLEKNEALEAYRIKISKSIESALLIQKAILPTPEKLSHLLKDYFILFRPKDVVSGDFYWANQIENQKFLIVADCTGHGVSGAFMTMIGSALLDRIINILKIHEPHLILEKLHQQIQIVLQQEQTKNTDGMDILVLRWEEAENEIFLDFSAAKRPLYSISPNDDKVLKTNGSIKMIGGLRNTNKTFEKVSLVFPKDTLLYLTSDGYSDQNNQDRKVFSEIRLIETLSFIKDRSLPEQKEFLEQTLDRHMAGTDQRDDILIMGVRL